MQDPLDTAWSHARREHALILFSEGYTLREIGEHLDRTPERARQMLARIARDHKAWYLGNNGGLEWVRECVTLVADHPAHERFTRLLRMVRELEPTDDYDAEHARKVRPTCKAK